MLTFAVLALSAACAAPASPVDAGDTTATQVAVPVVPTAPATQSLPAPAPAATLSAETISSLTYTRTIGYGETVRSVAFAPEAKAVASAAGNQSDFDVWLWGLQTGAPVGGLKGHTGIIWQIAFSPDGQYLASVSKDRTARIWDWSNGKQVQLLNFADEVTSVTFSPDGQFLAIGGVNRFPDAALWIYSTATWQPVLMLKEFWNIPEIAWSPDGQYIVAGGTSRNVRIWRVSDGAQQAVLSHPAQVVAVAVSPDGSIAVTAGCQASDANQQCIKGGVWIWNMPVGTLVRNLSDAEDWIEDVAFTPDGSLFLAGSRDGWLRAYSTVDFALVYEQWTAGGIQDIAISEDARLVATGRRDGRLDLWELGPQVP